MLTVAVRTVATLAFVLSAGVWAGSTTAAVVAPELFDQARAHGTARAIVQLRVAEGATGAEIAAVKQRVLAQIATTSYAVVRELPAFPLLVLDASEPTLRALAASSDVLRVSAETIDRPQK